MSTESLKKLNTKNYTNSKLDFNVVENKKTDLQISNLELNKTSKKNSKIRSKKICINSLQDRLRKKEVKSRNENRILYGLFISAVAVLFFAAT